MKKILIFFFFININLFALIPSIDKLPKNCCYFKNYYAHFSQWFDKNIFSWSEQNLSFDHIRHWYTPDHNFIFHYSWGIGWDPVLKKKFYTLTSANSMKDAKEKTKTYSTLPNYECNDLISKMYCKSNVYSTNKSPKKLPKTFPLSQDGNFLFKDFVTRSRFLYRNGKLERVYYTLNNIQVNWLPKELKRTIQKIGLETRLPVDRLSIDSDGRVIVYYP